MHAEGISTLYAINYSGYYCLESLGVNARGGLLPDEQREALQEWSGALRRDGYDREA